MAADAVSFASSTPSSAAAAGEEDGVEETSLSVDETNALRAMIGLASLKTGGGGNNGTNA